jgi:hypothetical protein
VPISYGTSGSAKSIGILKTDMKNVILNLLIFCNDEKYIKFSFFLELIVVRQ